MRRLYQRRQTAGTLEDGTQAYIFDASQDNQYFRNYHVEILVEEVSSDSSDPLLHISIRDHGKGYPEETLEKIRLFRETGEQQEGLGLGIQNTIERMRLIYQDRARVIFVNAPDGGAMAELYLPEMNREE